LIYHIKVEPHMGEGSKKRGVGEPQPSQNGERLVLFSLSNGTVTC
jgi:hypothetical protein